MKKPAIALGIMGVLVVAAAVTFRVVSSPEPSADAGEAVDAGSAVIDAGMDAGAKVVDAGEAPRAARAWTLNPRVFTSAGNDYATIQEAIDSAQGGTVSLQSGVYALSGALRIAEKTKFELSSRDGPPVYLRIQGLQPGDPAVDIARSSEVTLKGLVIEYVGAEDPPPAVIRAVDTSKLTLRQVTAAGGTDCIRLESSSQVVIDDALVGPCGNSAIHSADGRDLLAISSSRLFASQRALTLFQADPQSAAPNVSLRAVSSTAGIGFANFSGKVALTSSVLAERVRASVDAVLPFFRDSKIEVMELSAPPTQQTLAKWAPQLSAGQSLYVVVDAPLNPDHVGDAPGTDFSWNLTTDDRMAAAALAASASDAPPADTEQIPEGPVIVGSGASLPICGVGEKLKVYADADASKEPAAEIDTCDQIGGDIATEPRRYTLTDVTKTWVRIETKDGPSGYVMAKDLHAAEELDNGGTRILMPGYKCERGFSKAKDSILVRCTQDPCAGESCGYEEEGTVTHTTPSPVSREDHEITLPEGAKVKKTDEISRNFTAMCCT